MNNNTCCTQNYIYRLNLYKRLLKWSIRSYSTSHSPPVANVYSIELLLLDAWWSLPFSLFLSFLDALISYHDSWISSGGAAPPLQELRLGTVGPGLLLDPPVCIYNIKNAMRTTRIDGDANQQLTRLPNFMSTSFLVPIHPAKPSWRSRAGSNIRRLQYNLGLFCIRGCTVWLKSNRYMHCTVCC